jgi:zinc protease
VRLLLRPVALWIAALALLPPAARAQIRLVDLPGKSPLINFRFVFETGSAHDPEGKEGAAYLTAQMLGQAGTKDLTYKQVLDALFPMASSLGVQVDKEMTVFSSQTHEENLEAFYKIFRAMLLEPGWREEDFKRVKEDAINFLRVTLRGNNDEELGKEALYNRVHAGSPYGHHSVGTIASLQKLTLDDVKQFYSLNYTQDRLYIGVAGGYPKQFDRKVRQDFYKLPKRSGLTARFAPAKPPEDTRVTIIEKDTRSTAFSLGFPIEVQRRHPDFLPLLVASAYFGQHRNSGGRLYNRMREARGLNYGDYSYIEYFPRGMFQFEPDPNLARKQQIFQIWIRPVEPQNAHFALRLALFEFQRLVTDGLSEDDFQRTKTYLSKYVDLLMKTKDAELGYAIDSLFYQVPNYGEYVKKGLSEVTRDQVNTAIRKHLGKKSFHIVVVAKDAVALKKALLEETPSPMTYNSEKPQALLEEDKIVEKWKIGLAPENVETIPVERVFQ